MLRLGIIALLALLVFATTARAQAALGGCKIWVAEAQDKVAINQNHYKLLRDVSVECNDMQFFADEAEIFNDADRVNASGNVLFVTNNNRISADRMEFNTRTRTGTFFVASGIASLENRGIDRSLFGTQEPDAYFWGKTIEKLGPKTYRITQGGFTTCVQPTPRWEMVSDSVTLTLEQHALLKNTVLKVKGVPMMYLPILYYPINKEDRATGFLIPTYGASTLKGQTISNAFFWAINRSQDATLYHDFMSKTGQQYGGEYRYIQAPGAQGSSRFSLLREHPATYQLPNGTQRTTPGGQSYTIAGSMTQPLPHSFRMAATADYFSSLAANQRNQQNIFNMTSTQRRFGANVGGSWAGYTISAAFDRSEVLRNATDSNVYGSLPRVIVSRGEKPIGSLPLYFGVNSEYVSLLRTDKSATATNDRGLSRVDVTPTLRFPFTRWQFLTFNSALSWRGTFWSESQVNGVQTPQGVGRRYFEMSTRITGPVFTRIFNRPGGGYADKFKHVIEPVFTIQRITPIENAQRIVQLDPGVDFVVGNVTALSYGLNNRLYAKKETAREMLSVSISQSYYTDERAAAADLRYQSSGATGLPPSHVSPIALVARVSPTATTDATFRTEYDAQVHTVRTLAANGTVTKGWVQSTAGWSMRRFIRELPAFSELAAAQGINAVANVRKPGNALGGMYALNYDLKRRTFLQQRYIAYYNSQCCGVAVEYQSVNYGANSRAFGIPQDHRFNLSFTLAGIGTFSNLFGAFGGQTR